MAYLRVANMPKFQRYVISYVPIPNQVLLRNSVYMCFQKMKQL